MFKNLSLSQVYFFQILSIYLELNKTELFSFHADWLNIILTLN